MASFCSRGWGWNAFIRWRVIGEAGADIWSSNEQHWYCCELTIFKRNGMPCPRRQPAAMQSHRWNYSGIQVLKSHWATRAMVVPTWCVFLREGYGRRRCPKMWRGQSFLWFACLDPFCTCRTLSAFATPTPWSPLFNSAFRKTGSLWTFLNLCCL